MGKSPTHELVYLKRGEVERLREAHQEIVRKYERIMKDPPEWTNFTGDQLKWARQAWYGAATISRKALGIEHDHRPINPQEKP